LSPSRARVFVAQLRVAVVVVAAACLASSLARAEVRYAVAPIGDNSRIKVTLEFEAGPGPVEVAMPDWSPGNYTLAVHGRKVANLR